MGEAGAGADALRRRLPRPRATRTPPRIANTSGGTQPLNALTDDGDGESTTWLCDHLSEKCDVIAKSPSVPKTAQLERFEPCAIPM